MRGGLILLTLLLSLPLSAAELIVKGPLQLLAVSPQQSISGNRLILGPGEHYVLVRYEGVLSARSNSESDFEVTSDPQVLHLQVQGNETLTLNAPQLSSETAMEQYAKSPRVTLTGGASPDLDLNQQPIALKGFVLGINYPELLANHMRDNAVAVAPSTAGSPVAATAVVASPVAAAAGSADTASGSSPATTSKQQALQQLFLQATPEERKRFIGWAVQQL